MIHPVRRIGVHDVMPHRTEFVGQQPLAERLAHERWRAGLFERVLRAEELALARGKQAEVVRGRCPCVFVFYGDDAGGTDRPRWELWPAHPAFADEIYRWWPSDEQPAERPKVVIEDRKPDRPADVVLMPARGGLFDVWI